MGQLQKTCRICREMLSVEAFYVHRQCKGGRAHECKKCVSEASKAKYTPKPKIERKRLNPAEIWANHTPEKRAKMLEAKRAWRERNREKINASRKAWLADNAAALEKRRIDESNRRARKRRSKGALPKDIVDRLMRAQKSKCYYCKAKMATYHLDHIIPLSRGGMNDEANVVLACPPCNLSKSSKMPWEHSVARLV